ncbi:MAG: hypothetical protein GF368_05025 [Candidatus Aenigmarchaeota archaeon]|nr:hypothetical protein [Candidatus Aenigmarchaeota archaeon]
MSIPFWKIIVYGLFIGVTVSSSILFIFRLVPITKDLMISILYLYPAVGGITAYVTYKKINSNPIKRQRTETPKKQKLENKQNQIPKRKEIKIEDYKEKMERIKELKRTSLIIKGLIETKKHLEELKKESNSILDDAVKIMDKKAMQVNKNYLRTN